MPFALGGRKMKKLLLAAALVVPFASWGQTLTPAQSSSAFGALTVSTPSPGVYSVVNSSSGVPMSDATAATLAVGTTAALYMVQSGALQTAWGKVPNIRVVQNIPIAKFAPVLKKALPLVPVLGVGIALYDLAKELGFEISKTSPSAPLVITKQNPTTYLWYSTYYWGSLQVRAADQAGACVAAGRTVGGTNAYGSWCSDNSTPALVPNSSLAGTWSPTTEEVFSQAVASKTVWPSNSSIAKAVADALPLTGESVKGEQVTVTGPASTPISSESSVTQTATGSKKVTKDKNIVCSYGLALANNPGSLLCEEQIVTSEQLTTVDPVTKAATVSPSVVVSTDTSKETADTTAVDAAKAECVLNPNSLMCSSMGVVPVSDALSKTTKAVSVVSQTFASGGSCPSPLPFSVAGHSYSVSYQPLCDRLYILRVLFIALGGFLAAFILADSFKV